MRPRFTRRHVLTVKGFAGPASRAGPARLVPDLKGQRHVNVAGRVPSGAGRGRSCWVLFTPEESPNDGRTIAASVSVSPPTMQGESRRSVYRAGPSVGGATALGGWRRRRT